MKRISICCYCKCLPGYHKRSLFFLLCLVLIQSIILKYHWMKSIQIRSIFWSTFSRIRSEYEELLRISPYSVQMRENTDQKTLRIWTHFTKCTSHVQARSRERPFDKTESIYLSLDAYPYAKKYFHTSSISNISWSILLYYLRVLKHALEQ